MKADHRALFAKEVRGMMEVFERSARGQSDRDVPQAQKLLGQLLHGGPCQQVALGALI